SANQELAVRLHEYRVRQLQGAGQRRREELGGHLAAVAEAGVEGAVRVEPRDGEVRDVAAADLGGRVANPDDLAVGLDGDPGRAEAEVGEPGLGQAAGAKRPVELAA